MSASRSRLYQMDDEPNAAAKGQNEAVTGIAAAAVAVPAGRPSSSRRSPSPSLSHSHSRPPPRMHDASPDHSRAHSPTSRLQSESASGTRTPMFHDHPQMHSHSQAPLHSPLQIPAVPHLLSAVSAASSAGAIAVPADSRQRAHSANAPQSRQVGGEAARAATAGQPHSSAPSFPHSNQLQPPPQRMHAPASDGSAPPSAATTAAPPPTHPSPRASAAALSSGRTAALAAAASMDPAASPRASSAAASASSHAPPASLLHRAQTLLPSPTARSTAPASASFSFSPPPLLRANSVAPGGGSGSSLLSWVSQSNRELVRVFFGKKVATHRGILEGPFQGGEMAAAATAAAAATPAKHKSSLSISSAASSSSPAGSLLSLQYQLLHASPLRFHVALVGAAASGKTSTVHNITGRPMPQKHMETSGMHLVDVTWPYKSAEPSVYLLDLLFWDSGFTSSSQYKYIQTTPDSHAHLTLYVVSCIERASWILAQRRLEEDASKPFAKLLVLTKIDDRTSKREVHESDILAFQDSFNRQHYPAAATAMAAPPSGGGAAGSSPRSYTRGSLVVCKIANWPISNETFFTRPGVTSLLNTISAMCLSTHQAR